MNKCLAHNGRSHLMLNTVKRDKRREEFSHFKRLKEESADISNLKQQIIAMKRELNKQEEKIREDQKNENILANLYDKGVIDENGNIL